MSIYIIILLLWYFKYIIKFIVYCLLFKPYPYDIFKQALKEGLATTLKQYTIKKQGYAIVRVPLEINYELITTERVPIEQTDKFKKKNSVPKIIMEIALITSEGTSVFLQNYEDRGVDNRSKAEYMAALTSDQIQLYTIIIRKVLKRENTTIFNKIMIITWLLHFGHEPNNNDVEYMMLFCKALSNISDLLTRQSYIHRKREFFELLCKNINNSTVTSICGIWKQRKFFSIANITVEVSHNILAMTIQWTTLSKKVLKNSKEVTDIDTFFNKNAFAPFIASATNTNTRVVQVLGTSNDQISFVPSTFDRKCPYHKGLYVTTTNEIVPNGHTININPNFNAFGSNYRRCPGEMLTRIYLSELLNIVKILQQEPINSWPSGMLWGLDKI